MGSVFFNAINLGTGAILILSAQLIQDGGFTVGDLALFIYMLEWVAEFTWMIGQVLAKYKQIGISVDRMLAVMSHPPTQEWTRNPDALAHL